MRALTRREAGAHLLGTLALAALQGCAPTPPTASTCEDDDGDELPAPWGRNGTDGLAVSYRDPFEDVTAGTCGRLVPTPLGPCHADSPEREDLSEGRAGLPLRVLFRVVDTACAPIAGVWVDVWHSAPDGRYSGEGAAGTCAAADRGEVAGASFRGRQRTDARGIVVFDTCFPGWYEGRAIHVHVQVRTGTEEGDGERLTGILFFESALVEDIYATQPDYAARGEPSMATEEDPGYLEDAPEDVLFATQRQQDGTLLAWKDLRA
jgi:protocatechuate 3,4-dioxygenase beta subunit